MERATAPQMRKCLMMAEAFKRAGVRFVPMPVATEEEYQARCEEMERLLAAEIERDTAHSEAG